MMRVVSSVVVLSLVGLASPAVPGDELDHILPLCLDGAPLAMSNLQLQLWPVARIKDQREADACRAYCERKMTLDAARRMFTRDRQ